MRATRHDDHRTNAFVVFSMERGDGVILSLRLDVTALQPEVMTVVDEVVRRWNHFEERKGGK